MATTKWDDFEPELALLGALLQQACKDALQTRDAALRTEAWNFLDTCAPDVAEKLRTQGLTGISWQHGLT